MSGTMTTRWQLEEFLRDVLRKRPTAQGICDALTAAGLAVVDINGFRNEGNRALVRSHNLLGG